MVVAATGKPATSAEQRVPVNRADNDRPSPVEVSLETITMTAANSSVETPTTPDQPPAAQLPSYYWTWRMLAAGFSPDEWRWRGR